MPAPDRPAAASTSGKTLRPTLASNRTAKTPLTPKLAAATVSLTPSARPAYAASPTGSRDTATPGGSYSSNVTPRSSSRKSRASSTHSTPEPTPSFARPPFAPDSIPRSTPALGTAFPPSSQRPRSVVNGVGASHTVPALAAPAGRSSRPSSEVGMAGKDRSAMFFHASEVKPPEPATAPVAKKPAPIFFYANGERGAERSASGLTSPPLSASLMERGRPQSIESKFFHANTIPDAKNSPLHSPPILSASPDPLGKDSGPRPPSPYKDSIHLSYRKGASQVMRPNMHQRPPSAVSVFSERSDVKDQSAVYPRRSSAENNSWIGHGKSPSLSSIDSVASPNRRIPGGLDHSSSPVSSPIQVDITSPSTVQSERTGSTQNEGYDAEPRLLQSPISSPQSPALPSSDDADHPPQNSLQKMNELAANARRERKVLDLEISNSSLRAINRQLEREVRKQKAELKRFRRLSRAGRVASTGNNRSSILSSLTEGEPSQFEGDDLAGIEGEDDEFEDADDSEDQDISGDSSTDEGTLSPSELAKRDAKYRFQDQKRLELDLSKHRELLVDSQKMNQNLKRCLALTEDLIKEGKKALDHQVSVSDVKLGGRILTEEERNDSESESDEEGLPHGGSLLSPWTRPEIVAVRTSLDSVRTDRDSGIDLEGPKPPPDYFNGYTD